MNLGAEVVHPDREEKRMSTNSAVGEWKTESVDGDLLVHLARLALTGDQADIIMYIRRQAHRHRTRCPRTSQALDKLVGDAPPPSALRASDGRATAERNEGSRRRSPAARVRRREVRAKVEKCPDCDDATYYAGGVCGGCGYCDHCERSG